MPSYTLEMILSESKIVFQIEMVNGNMFVLYQFIFFSSSSLPIVIGSGHMETLGT